ncbi:MAG: hypothetical protein SGJ04_09840 [Bacteroidota bacterium]|nr:hypothetical protein [Bacteroidota bacterium]
MGIGSLTLFILTVLGRIDSTLGIASGTTAGVVASGVYIQMFAHFKRSGIKIP